MSRRAAAGFFGKLPCRGDFVSRRLPSTFIECWDVSVSAWLAAGLARRAARGEVDFLATQPWRFGLADGVCGEAAWVGVLVPSRDSVGRLYPLVVAAATDVMPGGWPRVPASFWFDAVEVACEAAECEPLVAFDAGIARLPDPAGTPVDPVRRCRSPDDRVFFWQHGREGHVASTLPEADAESWLIANGASA
jgi:type VI secretion system protein ImpM